MTNDTVGQVQMPVSHLSYSALAQLLRNPLIFKLKYILNVYDGKMGVSGMVGRAGHEALKAYYGGNILAEMPEGKVERRAKAIEIGLKYLDEFSDNYIDYGKTGSREQMLQNYTQAMQFYFEEEPEYNEIVMCEEKMQAELKTVDGDIMPIPAVGIPDLIHKRKDGGYEIIDTKFTKNFTDYETEDFVKIIQSMFLWHLLREAKGINADRMLFREIKTTRNSGENVGKPQIRDYAIPFSHEQYRIIFYNLYRDVVRFLANPNSIYLPNINDPFDGEQSGMLYAQGLISSDMSDVEVMHKVKDVALVTKNFITSRLDQIENKHLDPAEKIKMRLAEFGIPVEPDETKVGASVTQYRFKVSAGIRMTAFSKHKSDIARAIEAKGEIRILAPIPGTALVGIEVPNETKTAVSLSKEHFTMDTLTIPIGVDINGDVVRLPLDEMPHLLIGGSSGSGKSMLLHALITALTAQMKPTDMKMVLIDPKRVELRSFANRKHVSGKIIYEYQDAVKKLEKLVGEMEKRYEMLENHDCKDIKEYNKYGELKMSYIVVIIDEFADLMLRPKTRGKKRATEPQEANVEDLVVRLAQMARAVGIHLILATQRPSVDVITGLIKANFPTRIALTTASAIDSQVILGDSGAEKLNGKGDMILMNPSIHGKQRLQGFLVK